MESLILNPAEAPLQAVFISVEAALSAKADAQSISAAWAAFLKLYPILNARIEGNSVSPLGTPNLAVDFTEKVSGSPYSLVELASTHAANTKSLGSAGDNAASLYFAAGENASLCLVLNHALFDLAAHFKLLQQLASLVAAPTAAQAQGATALEVQHLSLKQSQSKGKNSYTNTKITKIAHAQRMKKCGVQVLVRRVVIQPAVFQSLLKELKKQQISLQAFLCVAEGAAKLKHVESKGYVYSWQIPVRKAPEDPIGMLVEPLILSLENEWLQEGKLFPAARILTQRIKELAHVDESYAEYRNAVMQAKQPDMPFTSVCSSLGRFGIASDAIQRDSVAFALTMRMDLPAVDQITLHAFPVNESLVLNFNIGPHIVEAQYEAVVKEIQKTIMQIATTVPALK